MFNQWPGFVNTLCKTRNRNMYDFRGLGCVCVQSVIDVLNIKPSGYLTENEFGLREGSWDITTPTTPTS